MPQALYLTRVHSRLLRPGLAQLAPHIGAAGSRLRRSLDAFEAAVDREIEEHALVGINLPPVAFTALELAAAAALLVLGATVPTRTLGRATLLGAGAMTIVILLAPWTSQGYWLYAGSVGLLGIALLDGREEAVPA